MYCILQSLLLGKNSELSPSVCFCHSQVPASNSVALDMSLQTPSDVKVKKEAPVEVDSSPPDSPESISENSDHSREPVFKGKVGQIPYNDAESVWLMIHVIIVFLYYLK